MDIIFNVGDGAFKSTNLKDLHEEVMQYFTKDGFSAEVNIDGDAVRVHVDEEGLKQAQQDLAKVRNLCDQGKFGEAEKILNRLLQSHPYNSEAYRLLAQIERENGNPNKALDILIDALRCDPKNIWALILMGNIFNQDLNEKPTALTYYEKVVEVDPENFIAINNIAAINAELGDREKAIEWFKKSNAIDPTYENAYYGIAMLYYRADKFEKAFEWARKGCVDGVRRPENKEVSEELRKLMLASAQAVTEAYNYQDVYLGIKDILEEEAHAEIREEADEKLQVYAQLQYGPARGRNWHLLRYNPKRPYIPHLMVHELMHLDMTLEANSKGLGGQVVYSNNENESKFRSRYASWAKKLTEKFGYTKAQEVVGQVLNGLMVQVMNCPLDLFVEKRMFDKYKVMRPLQLLSLLAQEEENIKSIEGASKAGFIPQPIIRASKIMNIVTSMHFEKLYGIRLYNYYKPTKQEFDTAVEMYTEYLAYMEKDNIYTPGEEYDLIKFFAETLDLEDFISFSPEKDFYWQNMEQKEDMQDYRDAVIGDRVDPLDGDTGNSIDGLSDAQKERQDNFYKQNKDGDDAAKTMMMAMYMVGALETFDGEPKSFIQRVAFEIAQIGMTGISPEVKDYVVKSLGDKVMSGYQLLAYYYVSWKLFNPELHKSLQLPFDTAWETALEIFNKKKEGN